VNESTRPAIKESTEAFKCKKAICVALYAVKIICNWNKMMSRTQRPVNGEKKEKQQKSE